MFPSHIQISRSLEVSRVERHNLQDKRDRSFGSASRGLPLQIAPFLFQFLPQGEWVHLIGRMSQPYSRPVESFRYLLLYSFESHAPLGRSPVNGRFSPFHLFL